MKLPQTEENPKREAQFKAAAAKLARVFRAIAKEERRQVRVLRGAGLDVKPGTAAYRALVAAAALARSRGEPVGTKKSPAKGRK